MEVRLYELTTPRIADLRPEGLEGIPLANQASGDRIFVSYSVLNCAQALRLWHGGQLAPRPKSSVGLGFGFIELYSLPCSKKLPCSFPAPPPKFRVLWFTMEPHLPSKVPDGAGWLPGAAGHPGHPLHASAHYWRSPSASPRNQGLGMFSEPWV